jgi:hypothetical protein
VKNRLVSSFACGVVFLLAGDRAFAHHGTNVSYQGDKTITLNGTVTEWAFAERVAD